MADTVSERLDKIANLLDKGFGVNTKSASVPKSASSGSTADHQTDLRMKIYMQAKKASYLDAFMKDAKKVPNEQ